MEQPTKNVTMGNQLHTMQDVQQVIAHRQRAISDHGFLRALDGTGTIENMKRVAPRVAFFVFGFQDVLRLAHSLANHPEIEPIAAVHALEDRDHDKWYLRDLQQLGVSLDIAWLFSEEHRITRDVTYVQIAEVIRAKHDQTRLAVALSLEALAAVFFDRAKRFLERIGKAENLDYFGGRHLKAEQSHELFEAEAQRELSSISVPDEAAQEIVTAIDRVFESMTTMASDLERAFHEERALPSG